MAFARKIKYMTNTLTKYNKTNWDTWDINYFDKLFNIFESPLTRYVNYSKPTTYKDLDNKVVLDIDLPGVNKDNINVQIEDNILCIQYKDERKNAQEYLSQKFSLGTTIDSQNVTAKYKNGVLTIECPKIPTKIKKIVVDD